MPRTIILQSYRTSQVPGWIEKCMASVRHWASLHGFEYRFIGDEIFDRVPAWYQDRAQGRMPVITDLGRLVLVREALMEGADTAVWIDADVLVFDAADFRIDIADDHAFGREIWVQPAGKDLKVYRNVHNAFCLFRQGNAVLDFYIHSCERIMRRVSGGVPNQIVGTKLLTALHNIIGFPLIDDVGMISPLVLSDVAEGGGTALNLLIAKSAAPLKAANLCSSLVGGVADGIAIEETLMERAVSRLQREGRQLFD
ncbi:MAG: hypothetical protein HOH04_13815 [Rhodospirillaceae bacterium]|nr:hypothetical protein [Rhodospirillaceae bacterium]